MSNSEPDDEPADNDGGDGIDKEETEDVLVAVALLVVILLIAAFLFV